MSQNNDTSNSSSSSNSSNSNGGESPVRKRHWSGSLGDRYEPQNVWVSGGAKSPAGTSPWAGWDAHRRRSSDASTGETGDTGATPRSPKSPSGATGSGLFANLTQQKRSSGDPQATERRRSFADQFPKKGFLASMWHDWTRG